MWFRASAKKANSKARRFFLPPTLRVTSPGKRLSLTAEWPFNFVWSANFRVASKRRSCRKEALFFPPTVSRSAAVLTENHESFLAVRRIFPAPSNCIKPPPRRAFHRLPHANVGGHRFRFRSVRRLSGLMLGRNLLRQSSRKNCIRTTDCDYEFYPSKIHRREACQVLSATRGLLINRKADEKMTFKSFLTDSNNFQASLL